MPNIEPMSCLTHAFIFFNLVTLLFVSTCSFAAQIKSIKETQNYLKTLTLNELVNVEVTSVSKKLEKLADTAAAIHVITQEDIRRSGVTSVPEALRLAPGINVARIDANKWAISARGLNGRFSAALLVLIDGREVYNPVFSGVLWDSVDLMMEDIERIEVIRGPGATLWGTNAVNGVINIITKTTQETLGGRLATYGGNAEASGALRYGGKIDDNTQYRAYVKYLHRSASRDINGNRLHDDQDIISGGMKMEINVTEHDNIILDGRYYESQSGQDFQNPTLVPPYFHTVIDDEHEVGGHFMAKWRHHYSDTSNHLLKVYYNHQNRKFPYMEALVDTLDFDFQHQFNFLDRHDIVWGLGYRYQYFESEPGLLISFSDETLQLHTYNFFIQDDITIIDNKLRLILGTKVEKPFFSDIQVQPSARFVWTPTATQTIWGAISRAARNPSIIDRNIQFRLPTIPPNGEVPVPTSLTAVGNPDIDSEELIAYELGYRIFFDNRLSLDISAFYNDYDDLTTVELVENSFMFNPGPPPFISGQVITTNNLKAESYGIELDASWQVMDKWRLTGYYSFIRMFFHQQSGMVNVSGEGGEDKVPEHQFSLRSSMDFSEQLHWDLWVRYVDALPNRNVTDYTTLDTRVAWRPLKNLELSVVGQNLIDSGHTEYTSEFVIVTNSVIERSFYVKVDWEF